MSISEGFDDDDDRDDIVIEDVDDIEVGLPDLERARPEVEQIVDPATDEVTLFEIDGADHEELGDEIARSWITADETDAVDPKGWR
jgi:hypothetical protein